MEGQAIGDFYAWHGLLCRCLGSVLSQQITATGSQVRSPLGQLHRNKDKLIFRYSMQSIELRSCRTHKQALNAELALLHTSKA